MRILAPILKHLLIYILVILLGSFLLSLAIVIAEFRDTDWNEFFGIVLIVSIFAVIFSVIPYVIGLLLIKRSKHQSVIKYAMAGIMCIATPFVLYIMILENPPQWVILGFVILILIFGAILGMIYGWLDKKIQIPLQKKSVQSKKLLIPSDILLSWLCSLVVTFILQ